MKYSVVRVVLLLSPQGCRFVAGKQGKINALCPVIVLGKFSIISC